MNTTTKRPIIRLAILATAFAILDAASLAQTSAQATGHWEGKIQMSNPESGKARDLGIAVDLAKSPAGAWIGSISVLASSATDVPLSSVTVEGAAVRFVAMLPDRASFDGQLSADSSGLSGTASNAEGSAPFQLTRSGEANVKIAPASSPLTGDFEGEWDGTLSAPAGARRVTLKLSRAADGAASATLIAVDHGNAEIPVTTVTIKDKELQFESRAVSGAYRGTLGVAGEITGEWSESGSHIPLTFKRAAIDANKPDGTKKP